MKIKINMSGVLVIDRAGVMKRQWCPFKDGYCGDSCPHFGEPQKNSVGTVKLEICQGRELKALACDFVDEREGK